MSQKIQTLSGYINEYQRSVNQPEKFWERIAQSFHWQKPWDNVLSWDFKGPDIKWFENAKLNLTENIFERHLFTHGEKAAIIWEPNDPKEAHRIISYRELFEMTCQFSNALEAQGVEKGDRVIIYMPMIPEAAVAMLACARIGAVHSVVFAGFSSSALADRINDCKAKMVITSDGNYRGAKNIAVKSVVDEALEKTISIEKVIVCKRTNAEVQMRLGRDFWWHEAIEGQSIDHQAATLDAEDLLFILYTSGSTGKPKGVLHTTGGYMVYASMTHQYIFNYKPKDIYWCTADIGWITGHSYILYGPLANCATTVMFEGVPSYPDFGRFWDIVEKHRVNQFYTAPTAIRALAKQGTGYIAGKDISSLKVLGTVGEPINEEAWNWYDKNIGKNKCPIVDTWWQTETGGVLISSIPGIIEAKPTFATLPFIGIQPVLMDNDSNEILESDVVGRLCIKFPWPSIARTIWGDHKRYVDTYFSAFDNMYFTGDGAYRDDNGNFRITGRVDDVIIVSGHNLGTAPIEDVINEHENVAESAIVGFPHDIKGNALYGFVTLKNSSNISENTKDEINKLISDKIGPIAKLDKIQFTEALPKTRSGKIMRRILRKIAGNDFDNLGDISTLLNPEAVHTIIENHIK